MERLGDYILIKKIGDGTFGEVFLAEHRFIKKRYAIKMLKPEFSKDSSFIKRFEDDISSLSTLEHPSIVKLHNISFSSDRYFIVMDAMADENGEIKSLDRYLGRNRELSEKDVETILKQLASAIDYARKTNFKNGPLVHGGIKPSNIFVDDSSKDLHVYISDFGFSSLIGEERVLEKSYEILSRRLGENFFKDFLFRSYEAMESGKVSFQSDSYSFGVLAYYIITNSLPYGYFDLPSKIAPHYKLNWDLLICRCLSRDYNKRPSGLTEAMNIFLSKDSKDVSSLDLLSWDEVEKKVENAMQMSFDFVSENVEKREEDPSPKPIIRPQEIKRPQYEPDPGAIFQKDLSVSRYEPQKVEVKEIVPILTDMVVIKGGTYKIGSNNGARDEMPIQSVTVSSFALDIHPVTNEQFVLFLESMGGEKDGNNNDIIRLRDSRIKRRGGKLIIESGYMKHPVVGVTWYGAFAYARWIGKKLPTEAQWEIAAKGGLGDDGIYPTGEKIDHKKANFFSSDTTAVMSYPPNKYGLYDMAGNVYEWCEDWYTYDRSSLEPENPIGPRQGVYRVLRGGCWKSLIEDLRAAHRHRNNPGAFNSTYGFRCMTDVS